MARRHSDGGCLGLFVVAVVVVWILQYWLWIVGAIATIALIWCLSALYQTWFPSAEERERRLLEDVQRQIQGLEQLVEIRTMLEDASSADREILNRTVPK